MSKRKKRWSYTAGQRPNRVTVFEREPGGILYARCWDPSLSEGKGGMRKVSLGHRDQARAKAYAHDQAGKLDRGEADLASGQIMLGELFDLYRAERTPRKATKEQATDERRFELWSRWLGEDKNPLKIALREWEGFIEARRSGAIDSRGCAVPAEKRRPVGERTVEADCLWIRWVFNWATRWMDANGRYVLRENPVRGFETPKEKNPRRPVATEDRYAAIRAVSDQVLMENRWNGKRGLQRAHLSELLDLANGTGRRISAICRLTYADLRLDMRPYGAIRWPADTDKMGYESVVPITPEVRAAIDRVLGERPGIGRAPLFPSPDDVSKPVSKYEADKWLRKAEKLAGIPTQEGSLWHAYRRKWATERKDLPDIDVAAAGGWKTTATLKRAYQQADPETMLEVVLHPAKLRGTGR